VGWVKQEAVSRKQNNRKKHKSKGIQVHTKACNDFPRPWILLALLSRDPGTWFALSGSNVDDILPCNRFKAWQTHYQSSEITHIYRHSQHLICGILLTDLAGAEAKWILPHAWWRVCWFAILSISETHGSTCSAIIHIQCRNMISFSCHWISGKSQKVSDRYHGHKNGSNSWIHLRLFPSSLGSMIWKSSWNLHSYLTSLPAELRVYWRTWGFNILINCLYFNSSPVLIYSGRDAGSSVSVLRCKRGSTCMRPAS